jgi:hypothetical protein
MIDFNLSRRQDEPLPPDLLAFETYEADYADLIDGADEFEPWDEQPERELDADDVMQADAAQDEVGTTDERHGNAEDLGEAKVHVTFFSDFAAKSYTTDSLTLSELQERIENASAREKSKLPWLKLAVFGNKCSEKRSLRHDANVVQITGIELDYDIEQVSFDDAVKAVEATGIHALLYTSASHTPEKPRWRILAPTSKPCAPELRYNLAARLNGVLKAKLNVEVIAKSESFALSQSYFYGWVCDSPKPHHRAVVVQGAFIDQRNDLAAYEASGGPPTRRTAATPTAAAMPARAMPAPAASIGRMSSATSGG